MSIKNLWAGIAFLLLNWTAAAAQGVAQSRAELVAAGDSLLSSYRIFEALGCYEEAWQRYADISAARGLAECHYRRGDYRRCVALLERVATVSEDSLTHTSLRQLVYSYKYFKNTAAELRWGELLLRKYPFDAEMTAEIARVYNMDEVNLPQRANALTKAYCERDSTNLSVLLQLADSYYFQTLTTLKFTSASSSFPRRGPTCSARQKSTVTRARDASTASAKYVSNSIRSTKASATLNWRCRRWSPTNA